MFSVLSTIPAASRSIPIMSAVRFRFEGATYARLRAFLFTKRGGTRGPFCERNGLALDSKNARTAVGRPLSCDSVSNRIFFTRSSGALALCQQGTNTVVRHLLPSHELFAQRIYDRTNNTRHDHLDAKVEHEEKNERERTEWVLKWVVQITPRSKGVVNFDFATTAAAARIAGRRRLSGSILCISTTADGDTRQWSSK